MVRNEADIIELFASHLLALFDDIVFVDHRSTDGTAEFLTALAKEFQQVQLLKLCEPAYIQSVAMTHVIRENPELRQADWNFFLDADEFLPFRSRDDFESSLTEYHRCPVISMHWQNIVPVEYWSDKVAITPETEFFVPPGFSPLQKVAFQPNKVDIDQITVAQGNHALTATLNGINLRAFNAKFPLLHIPVRSVPQISQKLTQGVRSYDVMGGARDPGQGGHWSRMKQVLEGRTLQDKHLYAMAMNYSEDRQTLIPIERDELVGYSRQRIEFATHPFAQRLVKRDAKDAGENLATIKTRPSVALTTCENGDLVEQVARLAEYEALPPDATQFDLPDLFENSDVAGGDRLASILHHLANRLRPRRYVALGTTCSGGVLALARKARASGFDCESVAVCTHWGNVGLDETARQSFEVFKFELSECCDKVSILQLDAAKASLRFEDASIDILSLEGTLDVTEVSEILERWHSKISDKGMVLLFKGCVQEWSWLQQNAGVQFQNWNVLHFPNYCVMARKQPVAALAS